VVSTGTIKTPKLIEIESELIKLGVPKGYYSLGREQNERTCILEKDNTWVVFYSERGNREDIHHFTDFNDAKRYVLSILDV